MPFIDTEIEESEQYEPGEDETGHDAQYSEYVMNRVKLSERLDSMDPEQKRLLVKMMQFKALKETLDAIKNLKSTSADTWKKIIKKLKNLSGIDIGPDKSGFDFNEMLKLLIPLLGALAGTLLGMRLSHKAEIEAATPKQDPDNPDQDILSPEEIDAELKKAYDDMVRKSVVLQMCDTETNGFSIDGNATT